MPMRSQRTQLEEISAMKKYSAVLALFFLTFTINAQSVWTGNASVGGSKVFSGESDVFRAASNTFPVGTVLRITNPRGGAEIDVTVTGRLETPGVFILIEEDAAAFIGLPDDHVLPVRVTPVTQLPVPEPESSSMETNELTEDTDYNPSVVLSEPAVEKTPEKEADVPEEKVIESARENETIITYDLTGDSADDTGIDTAESSVDDSVDEKPKANDTPEPASEPATEPETSGNKIYFLTPSDLRPPVAAEVKEAAAPAATAAPAVFELPRYDADSRLSYIQLGAYSSRAVLEDTMGAISRIAPGYPLSVDSVEGKDGRVYKLLIGPLSPAEIGIVLKTARSTSFPDAFPYRP